MRTHGDEQGVDPRDDVDRLVAGVPGAGGPALLDLVGALRASAHAPPPRPAGDLAALLRDGLPAPAPSRRRERAALRRRARTAAARLTAAGLAAQLAFGSGVALAAVGTSAGAGVLPEVVERTVSGLVHRLADAVTAGSSQDRRRDRPPDRPSDQPSDRPSHPASHDGPRPQAPQPPDTAAPAAPEAPRDTGAAAATGSVRRGQPQADPPAPTSGRPAPPRPAVRQITPPASPGPAARQDAPGEVPEQVTSRSRRSAARTPAARRGDVSSGAVHVGAAQSHPRESRP